jgi:hypothetical protein
MNPTDKTNSTTRKKIISTATMPRPRILRATRVNGHSGNGNGAATQTIPKPSPTFDLNEFTTDTPGAIANVETMLTALSVCRISQAKDYVRLHPDENLYWSAELYFVNVPIKGMTRDTLFLVTKRIKQQYLGDDRVQRFRLALASKPYDIFFLCVVPSYNFENSWNASTLQACEQAKRFWVQISSRRSENIDNYKIQLAQDQDAFPDPQWLDRSLADIIGITFTGRIIYTDDNPALLRLLGAKQAVE